MTKIKLLALTAALAVSALVPAAAQAEYWKDSRSTTGAAATCSVSTWDRYVRDQYARITCSLKDTSCDSHSVYIQWWQDGYGKVRLNNTNGCNWTTFPSDTRYNGDGAFSTLKWRVCRDIQRGRDNCSSTVVHYTY